MYRNEHTQQKLKVDKFVADGAEEWDIKNGVRRAITLLYLSHTI